MINNQDNYVLYAIITADLINSIIFKEALDIAREKNYPCFFVIDDSLQLPGNWNDKLKIEFLEYFTDRESLNDLSIKMYKEVELYNKLNQ